MRYILSCLLLMAVLMAQGQAKNYIRGKVVQEKSRQAIAGASVFINNSMKGTVSKADGSFELMDVPAGNHDLVISSIGYTTLVMPYTAAELPLQLEVQLKQKVDELQSVTVEPDEKDGWAKWGNFFLQNFIGTTANAEDCKLKNPEVLRFKVSKKNNLMTVVADEPLIIENKALGYTLRYQLEEFRYDFKGKFLLFLGYPLFEDISTTRSGLKNRWDKNREKAYLGSIQHFMHSLYHNQLAEEGFEVKRLIKQPNTEKARVRAAMQASIRAQREKGQQPIINFGDSSEHYNRILRQPDEFDIVLPALLTSDSLMAPAGENKTLFFTDYLYITYRKEKEEQKYLQYVMENRPAFHQRSTVFLSSFTPVLVDSKGNFAPITEFISYGYWSWSEKIANMLPLDYESGKIQNVK